jgi:hypothetical protein
LPVKHIAHAVVAGILGLELLASLGGENDRTLAMFDRGASIASLIPVLSRPTKPKPSKAGKPRSPKPGKSKGTAPKHKGPS